MIFTGTPGQPDRFIGRRASATQKLEQKNRLGSFMKSTILLSASCLVALTVSGGALAQDGQVPREGPAVVRVQGSGDPLIRFLVGTGGVISLETIGLGLKSAFQSVTEDNAAELPRLLGDLVALGIGPNLRDALEMELGAMVCSSGLSDGRKSGLLDSLGSARLGGGSAGVSGLTCETLLGPAVVAGRSFPVRNAY